MGNSPKNKGDRYERAALAYLREVVPPHLQRPNAMRMLGAGRKDDIGDLAVFFDAVVQVKAVADMGSALRQAARGATRQSINALADFAVGMVPVQGARANQVRWLASCFTWPGGSEALPIEPVEFKMVGRMLTWMKDDKGPYGYMVHPRTERVGVMDDQGTPMLVAPFEAWLAAYIEAKGTEAVASLVAWAETDIEEPDTRNLAPLQTST